MCCAFLASPLPLQAKSLVARGAWLSNIPERWGKGVQIPSTSISNHLRSGCSQVRCLFFEQHPFAINFWTSLTGIVICVGRKLFGYQSAVINNLLTDFDSGCNRRLAHPYSIECFHRGSQSFHRRHPFFYDPLCIWMWMRSRWRKTSDDYQWCE